MEALYSMLSAFIVGAVISLLIARGRTMWKSEATRPLPPARKIIRTGPFHLTLEDQPKDGKVWQYMTVNLGEHIARDFEECAKLWPREAIASAREALNEFEAKLNEEEERETIVEERETSCGATQA